MVHSTKKYVNLSLIITYVIYNHVKLVWKCSFHEKKLEKCQKENLKYPNKNSLFQNFEWNFNTRIQIRIGILMVDPDPDQFNSDPDSDPQPCF